MQVSVRHIVTQMPDSLAIDRAQPSDSAGVLEEVNDDDDMVRVFAKVHILRAYVRYAHVIQAKHTFISHVVAQRLHSLYRRLHSLTLSH